MRIAIVGTELCAVDARGGGLEQVLLRWAAYLGARHEVVVVSHGSPSAPDGVDTVAVTNPADLPATLRRIAPDVVSLHNRPQWWELVPHPARATVTFHNFSTAWMVDECELGRLDPIPASAVSSALARHAQGVLGGTVALTPPSIDPEFLAPGAWSRAPVVLSPNRLLRKKGVEDLLAVARRPEFEAMTFAFADLISPWVRPTAEHRALRRAIDAVPNAVRFPPARSAAELADRYRRCAVVACPVTEEEGLGLVALEAQACGAPLVTVDLGGLREATFAPNRCVPPHDRNALADALSASSTRSPDDGAGARAAVRGRFSPEASGAVFAAWLEAAGDRAPVIRRGC
ncbi:MAG: hypothetical protein NVSMB12_11170 [Acidimicrobiales bacterium]